METLKQLYIEAQRRLKAAGDENPQTDAAAIIKKYSGLERYEIILRGDCLAQFNTDEFWADIKRRENHEPLQYICGKWPFFDLDFFVGDGVLIPRPDTEVLVETAIEFLNGRPSAKILDLCAGSGCISTAILKNVENSIAVCVELSENAAKYFKKNISYHDLLERTQIIKADMLADETPDLVGGGFDIIVCNPPYIKSDDIPSLEPEVRDYEPRMALDGGKDGLIFYRAAKKYKRLLKTGGMAAFEIGFGQSGDVAAILKNDFHNVFIKKDYAGIDRVVAGLK
jgi:release factor glutamine methyltransferase